MGASQRRKGHDFERLVARMLRDAGFPCRRGRQGEGPVEPDIVLDPPGRLGGITPWIECGHGARMDVESKYMQAVRQSRVGMTPVAIVRRDRGPIRVMMTAAGLAACLGPEVAPNIFVLLPGGESPCKLATILLVAEMDAVGDVRVTADFVEVLDGLRNRTGG